MLALLNDHAGELPVPVQAIDWRSAGDRYKSPELPYEIRFFSAVLDDGGTVRNIYNDQIFAVDEAKVAQYAAEAFSSGETGGFVEDYRFARYAVDDGVLLTFLDCGAHAGGIPKRADLQRGHRRGGHGRRVRAGVAALRPHDPSHRRKLPQAAALYYGRGP